MEVYTVAGLVIVTHVVADTSCWTTYRYGPPPVFARMDGDHPAYVLYSSGTTGKPKCIVHRGLGVLLTHLKVVHEQGWPYKAPVRSRPRAVTVVAN